MYPLTSLFYEIILEFIKSLRSIPGEIYAIIYDPRFTPECLIDDIRSNDSDNINYEDYINDESCYYFIMEELESIACNSDLMTYVCDSIDINDDNSIYGDYLFHIGMLTPEVPFLYLESSHMYAYPPRLILYGPEFQIEIRGDRIGIEVYEVVPTIRNKFFIKDEKEKINAIKDFLLHSDRPSLLD